MLDVVKFHTNIANTFMAFHDAKKNYGFSIHKVILTFLGGGRFFRT